MPGYKSKKMMSDFRDFDPILDTDYHYRETSDMIMEKANTDLFYNLRHLKMFKDRTKMQTARWFIKWDDGKNIVIHDEQDKTICELDDIVMAEYICSLHNMSNMMIKEVDSKYANQTYK
jgi:hypothetical protein